jgi:hypothetical protein
VGQCCRARDQRLFLIVRPLPRCGQHHDTRPRHDQGGAKRVEGHDRLFVSSIDHTHLSVLFLLLAQNGLDLVRLVGRPEESAHVDGIGCEWVSAQERVGVHGTACTAHLSRLGVLTIETCNVGGLWACVFHT